MISLMVRLENNSVNMKIVRDESGKMIQLAEGILCEYVDSDGNTTLKFVQTTDSCCSESLSEIESENMPCSTASFNHDISTSEKKNSPGASWEDNESKYLLQLYYENIKQIGPFSTFKNKKCMWEFISNELTKKYGTFHSSLQCEYRYKNMLKRRNAAKKNNKKSGNKKYNVAFEEEFELINSI
ncbi:PREDICTED: uncharacterized protein LOC108777574 [Cyphomyrmex costatus]|uniref:uncharacterized protein LOC108777574 n=1 Tax=Cyphomyrmex costatus TaxID=456900 RepID=UPI000852238A|nr:PREDICTED: uncharacterized protein LOC108777574 [Cyphomyrmex costatus]